MKKQKRQIIQFAACLMTSVLISGILCPSQALAQTKTPLAQKSDRWTVGYMVTVKGEFTIEPELGSDGPVVTYKIDRKYTGLAHLVFETRTLYSIGDEWRPRFFDPHPEVTIEINDSRTSIYDWLCEERDRIEETWKGKTGVTYGAKYAGRSAQLMIDNTTRRYEVIFPLYYDSDPKMSQSEKIAYVSKRFHEKQGTGEKKLVETKTDYKDYWQYQVPGVNGFIKSWSIIGSDNWSNLKEEGNSTFNWVSNDLYPDENLYPGVPKDKVKILISYTFIRH
jgi:hypothetical protein